MKQLVLLVAMLFATASICRADIVIGDPPSFGVNIKLFEPTGQSFIADRSAIKSIGMWTATCNCANQPQMQFRLTLFSGAGTTGSTVAVRTATAANALYGFVDFDFTGISLTVGQTYTAVMTQVSPDPPTSTGTVIYGTPNNYSGGTAFISGLPRPDLQLSLRVIDDPMAANALQYAAKILCGVPDKQQSGQNDGMVALGTYFTTINIHNPGQQEAFAKMKVATTKPDGKPGVISTFHSMRLGPDGAIAVSCSEIQALAKTNASLLDGFLVVESDFSLDVVAVYTGAQNGQLATFGIERVPARQTKSGPR